MSQSHRLDLTLQSQASVLQVRKHFCIPFTEFYLSLDVFHNSFYILDRWTGGHFNAVQRKRDNWLILKSNVDWKVGS